MNLRRDAPIFAAPAVEDLERSVRFYRDPDGNLPEPCGD